jgi:hypothetical protein
VLTKVLSSGGRWLDLRLGIADRSPIAKLDTLHCRIAGCRSAPASSALYPTIFSRNKPYARGLAKSSDIGYRRRSSTRMVAPKASSASSKNAKWCAHQSSELPGIVAVSTTARAEQRSHRSAAIRVRAGFLSREAFISATSTRASGDFFDTYCGSAHRDKRPTSDWSSHRSEARLCCDNDIISLDRN